MPQTMADLLQAEGKGKQLIPPPTEVGYNFPEEGIPLAYLKSIRQAESNYGLPKNLLPRLFKIESNFNAEAVNPNSGASGIAQIMPKIHPNVDPFNASASIDYAAKYLRDLHDKHGNWESALAEYGGFKDIGKAQGYISSVTSNKSMAALLKDETGGETMADLLKKESAPKVNPLLPDYIERANRSVESYKATEAMAEASKRAEANAAAQPPPQQPQMGPPLPPEPMKAEEFPGESRMEMVPSGGIYGGPSTPFRYTVSRPPGPPGPIEEQVREFAKGAGEILEAVPGAIAGATVGGMIAGVPGAFVGAGFGAALSETYDAWKKGDVVKLANIATFGAIPNAVERLNAAGTELVNLRPTAALSEIAKAVPIFGPMAAAVEESLRTGQYARAGGQLLAILGLPLAGVALSDKIVPRASVKAAKSIEPIIEEAKGKVEEIAKTEIDPAAQEQKVKVIEEETKATVNQVIKDTATAEVIKEETKGQAAEIKQAKVKKVRMPKEVPPGEVAPKVLEVTPEKPLAGLTRQEKIDTERARLEEETRIWLKEHPKEKKVTAEEAVAKLEAATEEKPTQEVRPKIERTKRPEVVVTEEDYKVLENKFGEDWMELSIEELEDFLIEKKGLEVEKPIEVPKPKEKMTPEELKTLTKRALAEEAKPITPAIEEVRPKIKQTFNKGDRVRLVQNPDVSGTIYSGEVTRQAGEDYIRIVKDNGVHEHFPLRALESVEVKELVQPKIGQTEPLTEVDTQTGTPSPNIDSVFKVDDSEVIANRTRAYSKNKMVAANIEEIFNSDVYKDPSTTSQKLINDVNRWLKGEEVDIETTRNFLSELAARADTQSIIDTFTDESGKVNINDFRDWKDTVSEAASWARKADVPSFSIQPFRERQWVPTLYSGLPIDKLADAFKGFMGRVRPIEEGKVPLEPNIGIDKIIDNAKEARDAADKARKAKGFNPEPGEIKKNLVRSLIDKSGNIREDFLNVLGNRGYDIVQKMVLSKGGSARATNMLRQMRKEVYGGLSKSDKRVLDNLILYTRIMDIASYKKPNQVTFPKGMEPEKAASYLASYEGLEHLSPTKAYEMFHVNSDGTTGGKVGAYYKWMKKALKDMLDEGLVSDKDYDELVTHNYRRIGSIEKPTTMADLIDKKYEATVGNVKRNVYDSGIERLQKGKKTDIFETSGEIMALETFNRAYGRIMNNQANRSLWDLAHEDESNPFVRYKKPGKEINTMVKDLKDSLVAQGIDEVEINKQVVALKKGQKIPRGWTPSFVYIEGQRRTIFLSPDMAKEWITNTRDISSRAARLARYASFSPVTRTFATGIEWVFALANLPRDVAQIWWAARAFDKSGWKSIYSSQMPVYSLEIAHDIGSVFKDAVMRRGRLNDLMDYGGGMDFLVHQARPFSRGLHLEGPTERVYNFLGYFGETSELVTRLAVVERVLRNKADELGISVEKARKNPDIMREAVFVSRDYMDFGTGGWATKAADNAIPYLNAATVGLRGFMRSFKPGSGSVKASTYKLAQFAGATVGLYLASKWFAPRTHRDIKNDINSQNNIIIPLGDSFGFKDTKGQMRYPYIKIPLDQNLRFFKKLFEASTDKWLGEPIDAKGTANALSQLSPVSTSSLPPTVNAALGYYNNIDFWRAENIVDKPLNYQFPKWATGKKYGGSEEERTSGQTPAIAGAAGTATGLSPDRLRFVMRSLIGNSMWGSLVGGAYDKMFSDVPQSQKQLHLAEVLAKTPGFSRFIGITNPRAATEKIETDAQQHSIAKRMVEDTGLDARVNGYLYDNIYTRKDVIDFIRSQKDITVEKRMLDDLEFSTAAKDLPHKGFWLSLRRMPVDARAEAFVGYLNQALPGEKAEIRKEMGRVNMIGKKPDKPPTGGGVFTDEFWMEVGKLKRAGVKYPGLQD